MAKQASASYATGVVKNILTEVLPYLHISKTEEMTIAEQEEVDRMLGNIVQGNTPENEDGNGDAPSDGTKEGEQGEQGEQEGQEFLLWLLFFNCGLHGFLDRRICGTGVL